MKVLGCKIIKFLSQSAVGRFGLIWFAFSTRNSYVRSKISFPYASCSLVSEFPTNVKKQVGKMSRFCQIARQPGIVNGWQALCS